MRLQDSVTNTEVSTTPTKISKKTDKLASSTPTKTSKKTDPVPGNNRSERDALAEEHMFFNDKASFNKYDEFKDVASSVLVERGSGMSVRSINMIEEYQDSNAATNEDTYFKGALDYYTKPSRTVTITKPNQTIEQIVRLFSDDRLAKASKSTFVKNMLPTTVWNSAMKDSVPDFVFGIKAPEFARKRSKISTSAKKLVNVSGTIPHCFFVIETKGADEPFADAETQAIRSGAVLVNARRLLMEKAGILSQRQILGPDMESFVYTCAWMPAFARVFVNWCQVEEDVVSYHMNHLKSYKLDDHDDIKSFRDTVHSIFDWGLGHERVQKIEALVRAVEENESNKTKPSEKP